MKPVDQDKFGSPGGNCFSACVASLFEIPLEEVPYFMDSPNWWDSFLEWLETRGWTALSLPLVDSSMVPPGLHILSGQSPRFTRRSLHAVVAKGRKIVHDPHPDRAGIVTREDAVVLVPLDPVQEKLT